MKTKDNRRWLVKVYRDEKWKVIAAKFQYSLPIYKQTAMNATISHKRIYDSYGTPVFIDDCGLDIPVSDVQRFIDIDTLNLPEFRKEEWEWED